MTKLNWNRPCFNKNLGPRAYTPIKKKVFKPIDPIHNGHKLKASYSKKPHYGRLDCVTCNKFVKWLSNEEYSRYK